MKKKAFNWLPAIIVVLFFIVISFIGLILGRPKVAESERYLYKNLVRISDSGGLSDPVYHWREDFDDEVAAVQFESGLVADEWTTAGDNYAAAQVVYAGGVNGTLTMTPDGTDDSSNNIIRTSTTWSVAKNPILEGRFKVDDISDCAVAVGFTTAVIASLASPTDDMCFVYLNHEPAAAGEDLNICLWCSDNDTDVSNDLGVDATDDTFIKFKIDLADPNQPRVWIDDTEIADSLITGTVKTGTTLYPFVLIEDLAANAPVLTLDYLDGMQER